ncbi:MAG: RNA-binding protein [Proteobacteria bacterium]|nr:RNA-binding protein [Pseudomonadota bacterium]
MSNKIYVGNLSYRTVEDQLTQQFSKFGQISNTVIVMDRATNRSKGFGFITFDNENAAQQAVQEMNGKEIDGRTVKVSIAKPPKEREGGGAGGGGRPGGRSGGFGARRDGGGGRMGGGRGGNY